MHYYLLQEGRALYVNLLAFGHFLFGHIPTIYHLDRIIFPKILTLASKL